MSDEEQDQNQTDEEQEQKKVTFREKKPPADDVNKTTDEDEEEGRRSRASKSSRANSAGSVNHNRNGGVQDVSNNTNLTDFDKKRNSNAEINKTDSTDGLGGGIEIANYAEKSEPGRKTSVGSESNKIDNGNATARDSDNTKDEKRVNDDNETNDNVKNNAGASGSHSLNSRVRAKTESEPKKSEIETFNDTTDTTVYTKYLTDDDKEVYTSDEDGKDKEQTRDSNRRKSVDDTSSDDDDYKGKRDNREQTRERKYSDSDESVGKYSKDDSEISNDSKRKTENTTDKQAQSKQKNAQQTAHPQSATSDKTGGNNVQKKRNDTPHLVTKYKKPPQATTAQSKEQQQKQKQRNIAARDDSTTTPTHSRHANRHQVSQSARYPPRSYMASRESSSSRTSRSIQSRPRTTLGFTTEARRKEREFFHAELQRLKDSLRKESKKIKKPPVRDHYPDVFTSLEPYYNTYTANYLIKMPDLGYEKTQPKEEKKEVPEDIQYTTRKTAIGLCDPWQSLEWDKRVLPKLETAENRRKRMEQIHHHEKPKSAGANKDRSRQESPREQRPEAKQGSTRLPKFPVIAPPNSDITTKELDYCDVPMLRDEMVKSFSHFGEGRKKSDYQRTRQDFFRMELDRLSDYHRSSRPHMRAAYFAYLQNTPGSRKAIYDCMKEMNGKKKDKEQTPQAVA